MKTALYKLDLGGSSIPVRFVRARNARRYILRVLPENIARVTIPRGGSLAYAWEFTRRHAEWLQKQIKNSAADWADGTAVFFRGSPVLLRILSGAAGTTAMLGSLSIPIDPTKRIRPQVEQFLAVIAAAELIPLTRAKATQLGIEILKVRVANQRTRWGSCSSAKTICLNWRLIQAPDYVRDYIIIHELMHLREMNHSSRFWAHVAAACPAYMDSENWLRKNSHLLR